MTLVLRNENEVKQAIEQKNQIGGGRQKSEERVYYEELFEALGIPFRRRGTKLYFINPVTERQNDVTLGNLRRAVNQMINSGDLDSDWEYEEVESSESSESSDDSDISYNEGSNIEEEKEETRVTYNNPTFSTLYHSLKEKRGELVRVVIYIDGNIELDLTRRIPEIGFGGFWQELTTYELIKDSDNPLIPTKEYTGSYDGHTYSMDIITIQEITGGEPIIQHFQDGFKHCILHPIKEWAEGCLETSKSRRTERRYKKILKDINKLLIKYKDGVPQHQLQAICELLQIDIRVDLPLDIDEPYLFCKSTKKRLKVFEFINTRLDHVELNEFVLNEPIKNVSRYELYQLKEELDSKCQYYIYKKDLRGLSSITSFQGKYTINNEYSTVKNEFEDQVKLNHCKIDDIADGNLSTFIKCGTHYNSTIDFKDVYPYDEINRHLVKHNDEQSSSSCLMERRRRSVKHIDMSKAYANFHKCKWYEGFMGNITDFRKTRKIVTVGLYLVETFDFKDVDPKLSKYNDILRVYHNNNIYGSPELKMLSSMGVTYKIKAGCWGVKPLDFKFNDPMLNKKDSDGNKFYAKWTGASDQHKLDQSFYMRGDKDLFQNIRNYVSEGTVRWVGVDEGCISYKKDTNFHLGHITAQITMYMRMNMIEQLLAMDISKIIRVCVDGIYYLEHEFKIQNVFRTKEDITFENEAGDRYASNIFLDEDKDNIYDKIGNEFADEREHYGKELHLGAGGTGKTHKALTDRGLVRVLYVAPSRKLVRKKNADYAITSDVLANLIINDSIKYNKIARFFNVLVLDEVSMYSEKNKQAIFSRFEYHKLIFCGDVGYQLPTWGDEPITTKGFDLVKNHTKNYRIQCPELQQLCQMIRDLITKGIETEKIDNYKYRKSINKKVEKFFIKRNRMIDYGELKELYDIKDYILVGTKKIGWEYTEMFKGRFEEEKYYVTSNMGDFSNGDVICDKEKPLTSGIEVRHHFTTHSIQGETIETNIFIDCSTIFDSRMFYTAISRARRLSQIYLVQKTSL